MVPAGLICKEFYGKIILYVGIEGKYYQKEFYWLGSVRDILL